MAMFAEDTALEPSLPGWCSTGRATLTPALFCCLVSVQRQKIRPPYPWEALFHGMPRDEATLKPHSVSWRAQGRVCSKD